MTSVIQYPNTIILICDDRDVNDDFIYRRVGRT